MILLCASCLYAQIVLENDEVCYEFEDSNGGLVSMIDKRGSIDHIHAAPTNATLWALEFGNGTTCRSADYALKDVSSAADPDGTKRLTMTWAVNPQISVTVKAALANHQGIASFTIFVDNHSQQVLRNVVFPSVSGFLVSGGYDVAWPTQSIGLMVENAVDHLFSSYPDGYGGIMQFAVMVAHGSTNGVYFAAEDRGGGYKTFGGTPGSQFEMRTLVADADSPGSDFNGDFPVRLGVFQGNWIQGCKIYRQFAITAPWASKGRLSQRASMSQKFKDIGLWMRYGDTPLSGDKTPAENNAKLYEAEAYFAGIPLGVDYYFWHNNTFDYDLPNFLPPKPGYAEAFADLAQRGWLVEPYINCRIVTQENVSDYTQWLTVKPNGGYYIEFYATDSYVVCPYTLGWQNKIAQICSDVFETGANSIYLDQLAAGQTPCYNTAHGHRAGGGDYWYAGFKNMMDTIRNDAFKAGREISISGEFTNEIYMAGTDAFLFWQMSTSGNAIPMFPMVYSGYTLMKGSNASFTWTEPAWRMFVGRPFLWGLQCGWMTPDELFAFPSRAQYLRSIGLYRGMAKEYVTYGELVDLINGEDLITVEWQSQYTLPAIQGAVWKSERGRLGILLTNFDSVPRTVHFTLDTRKYFGEQVRRIDVSLINNRGTTLLETRSNGECSLSRTIYPAGIDFLEIKPSLLEGDINGDQRVNLTDVMILGEQWLE